MLTKLSSLFLFFFLLLESANAAPVVSVRIGKSLKNIQVSGLDLKRHLIFNDDIKKYDGRKIVKFNCETYTTLNRQKNKPILLATLESPSGVLSYEDVKYHGMFKVVTNPKGDSCDIINDIPMEAYISTLLTKEMNQKWPLEALKAQAVAARTYALHKMKSQQVSKELGSEAFYDLESSERHQVSGALYDSTERTITASNETKGEVLLTKSGDVRPIFFHAKCGGKTLRPDQVWHNKEAGYESVNCPFCHNRGPKGWANEINMDRLKAFFTWAKNQKIIEQALSGDIKSLILVPDNIDKLKVNLYVNGRPYIVEKTALRRFFGNVIFPSNSFALEMNRNRLIVNGEGLGHGVGMCQIGALALAQRGWSYKKILAHYFPGHVLKKMY